MPANIWPAPSKLIIKPSPMCTINKINRTRYFFPIKILRCPTQRRTINMLNNIDKISGIQVSILLPMFKTKNAQSKMKTLANNIKTRVVIMKVCSLDGREKSLAKPKKCSFI